MPQLSIETYVSQYFWFMVIAISFYILNYTSIMPKISGILKTREFVFNLGSEVEKSEGKATTANKIDGKVMAKRSLSFE